MLEYIQIALVIIGTIAVPVLLWIGQGHRALRRETAEREEKSDKRIGELETETRVIKSTFEQHISTDATFHTTMEGNMDRLERRIERMDEKMDRLLERIPIAPPKQ